MEVMGGGKTRLAGTLLTCQKTDADGRCIQYLQTCEWPGECLTESPPHPAVPGRKEKKKGKKKTARRPTAPKALKSPRIQAFQEAVREAKQRKHSRDMYVWETEPGYYDIGHDPPPPYKTYVIVHPGGKTSRHDAGASAPQLKAVSLEAAFLEGRSRETKRQTKAGGKKNYALIAAAGVSAALKAENPRTPAMSPQKLLERWSFSLANVEEPESNDFHRIIEIMESDLKDAAYTATNVQRSDDARKGAEEGYDLKNKIWTRTKIDQLDRIAEEQEEAGRPNRKQLVYAAQDIALKALERWERDIAKDKHISNKQAFDMGDLLKWKANQLRLITPASKKDILQTCDNASQVGIKVREWGKEADFKLTKEIKQTTTAIDNLKGLQNLTPLGGLGGDLLTCSKWKLIGPPGMESIRCERFAQTCKPGDKNCIPWEKPKRKKPAKKTGKAAPRKKAKPKPTPGDMKAVFLYVPKGHRKPKEIVETFKPDDIPGELARKAEEGQGKLYEVFAFSVDDAIEKLEEAKGLQRRYGSPTKDEPKQSGGPGRYTVPVRAGETEAYHRFLDPKRYADIKYQDPELQRKSEEADVRMEAWLQPRLKAPQRKKDKVMGAMAHGEHRYPEQLAKELDWTQSEAQVVLDALTFDDLAVKRGGAYTVK